MPEEGLMLEMSHVKVTNVLGSIVEWTFKKIYSPIKSTQSL